MSRTRVGVIGAGRMGMHHVRVFSTLRNAELVGVVDKDPARRDAVRSYDVEMFSALDDLLPKVDAVSIAVPTSLHHAITSVCLDRGVHVLVEKPITREVRDAEDLIARARDRGVVLQVGHVERFNPAVQELQRLLATETVLAISSRRCSPPTPYMDDVDVVYDLLIHDLDIALAIAGSPVHAVSAMGSAMKGHQTDLVLGHVEFANGVLADLVASKITQQRIRQLEVTTERTFVTLDYLTRDISVYREATVTSETGLGPVQHTQGVVIAKPVVRPVEPLYAELEHFLAVIHGATPVTTAEDALAALKLAERIDAQIAAGIAST